MKHSDFKIGMEFTTALGERLWRVTDIGTRTIIAIRIDDHKVCRYNSETRTRVVEIDQEAEKHGWFNGPPYAINENVFDEYDIEGCEPVK